MSAARELRSSEFDLPRLADLGDDLLGLSGARRAFIVVRPLAMIGAFAVCAELGWWVPALLVLGAVFPVMVAVVHDLLHGSLGLSPRANAAWLSVMGVLVLQSGHAIQATHRAHHRRFPSRDDPEIYVAWMPLARALLEGPVYPVRLWRWALAHHPERRRRAQCEAVAHALVGAASVALLPVTVVPFVYVAAMFVGCSLFPAISVNLLHHVEGDTALDWTRTVRGLLLPIVTAGSGYHLEHHLYPGVPSPHYGRLARRVRPALDALGVEGYRVF